MYSENLGTLTGKTVTHGWQLEKQNCSDQVLSVKINQRIKKVG
jgi:hypothetical protein